MLVGIYTYFITANIAFVAIAQIQIMPEKGTSNVIVEVHNNNKVEHCWTFSLEPLH